jgi:hypothetical protein
VVVHNEFHHPRRISIGLALNLSELCCVHCF